MILASYDGGCGWGKLVHGCPFRIILQPTHF